MELAICSILLVLKRITYHSRTTDMEHELSIFGFRLYIYLIPNLARMSDHKKW